LSKIKAFKILELAESREPSRREQFLEDPVFMIRVLYETFGSGLLLSEMLQVLRENRNFSLIDMLVVFSEVRIESIDCYGNRMLAFFEAGYTIVEIEEVLLLLSEENPGLIMKLQNPMTK